MSGLGFESQMRIDSNANKPENGLALALKAADGSFKPYEQSEPSNLRDRRAPGQTCGENNLRHEGWFSLARKYWRVISLQSRSTPARSPAAGADTIPTKISPCAALFMTTGAKPLSIANLPGMWFSHTTRPPR